ncbi:MAG: proton-conducting transporter membrane subunit, partial [Terracidiphilus sp.]
MQDQSLNAVVVAASIIGPTLVLVPAVPMIAAGAISLMKQKRRKAAARLAIGSLGFSFLYSLAAFILVASRPGMSTWTYTNWFQVGQSYVELGSILDPLSAVMLVMVSFVGLLIFIYSVGYMERDENFTRFFCFMSLFAGAMLGVVIANSVLLLFMCWELVGLTSYLLIGFWYQKPSAAAAAKKAFL